MMNFLIAIAPFVAIIAWTVFCAAKAVKNDK